MFPICFNSSSQLAATGEKSYPLSIGSGNHRDQGGVAITTRAKFFLGSASAVVAVGALLGIGALTSGTEPRPAEAGIWDVPADACDDPQVLEAVQAALNEPEGSVANSALARPDEVDAALSAQQRTAWNALTPEKLAFQHCLAAQSGKS